MSFSSFLAKLHAEFNQIRGAAHVPTQLHDLMDELVGRFHALEARVESALHKPEPVAATVTTSAQPEPAATTITVPVAPASTEPAPAVAQAPTDVTSRILEGEAVGQASGVETAATSPVSEDHESSEFDPANPGSYRNYHVPAGGSASKVMPVPVGFEGVLRFSSGEHGVAGFGPIDVAIKLGDQTLWAYTGANSAAFNNNDQPVKVTGGNRYDIVISSPSGAAEQTVRAELSAA